MTKKQQQERDEYRERLLTVIAPGDTVFTVIRHRSRSGMYRALDIYVMHDGRPFRITFWTAKAIGARYDDRHEALGISGCGMDMGFHVVYSLSRTLFPDGYDCIGERCPSNDHSNGDRNREPHHHQDGGYALRHEWI